MNKLRLGLGLLMLLLPDRVGAETIVFQGGVIHVVTGKTLTNGSVLIEDGKISAVSAAPINAPAHAATVELRGQHLYPGLIALDTSLGITEIEAVRATRDTTEVGDYTPDVESWVAVNPDSELIPVARANGFAAFETAPRGRIVAGQSALMASAGWTYEQMLVRGPAALHLFWPGMDLNLPDKTRDPKAKSLDDQARERSEKLRSLAEFFNEARAYAKARNAAAQDGPNRSKIPAWESMLPYVRAELPIVIHADEVRQIRAAIHWAATNNLKIILAGGRDAAMLPELLVNHQVPLIYEHLFVQPARDTDSWDLQYRTPELLRRAGVKVTLSLGSSGYAATAVRNLPYAAALAIAHGLPETEALKALTLYPAELMGAAARLGSLEAGKDATLFICDGNIFDLRSNVKRMWIGGIEVSLESRHTRLYERYRNRP